MEQLSFQHGYLYPLGLGCPFGSNTLGLLWLAPISFENCVLHSSTGKSFGWVCLDHIPSKISSYLASLQAVHGGISCKYNWVLLKSSHANSFAKQYVIVSQVIQIYNLCTSITAEGWTKLVSLHIVYVSAPSFIYHTSFRCITIALKSRHPDEPGVANSSSCSEGAVQNTYTK